MTAGAAKLLESAIAKYKSAASLDPQASEVHNNWANALSDLAGGSARDKECSY